MSGLRLKPITLKEANSFTALHHRHHKPVRGCKFVIGAVKGDEDGCKRAVLIAGRPSARNLDDGYTVEFTRLTSNGAKNACSFLYSAGWRAARAMGFTRAVTYLLESEEGKSLKALKEQGWRLSEVDSVGGSWSRDDRPRGLALFPEDKTGAPECPKRRWEVNL